MWRRYRRRSSTPSGAVRILEDVLVNPLRPPSRPPCPTPLAHFQLLAKKEAQLRRRSSAGRRRTPRSLHRRRPPSRRPRRCRSVGCLVSLAQAGPRRSARHCRQHIPHHALVLHREDSGLYGLGAPPPAPARGAVREASSSLELLHLLLHGHHRHEAQREKLALDQQVRPPPLPCLAPSRSPAHHSAVLPTCSGGDADLEQRGHQGCGPRRRRVQRAVRPRVRRARRQQVPKGGRRGGWVVFFFFLSVHSDSHPCSRLLVQQRPSRRRRRKRAQRRVDTRSHRSRERDEWRWRRRRRAVCAAAFNTAGGAYGLPGAESGMGVR